MCKDRRDPDYVVPRFSDEELEDIRALTIEEEWQEEK